MLTGIKNAGKAELPSVVLPYSKMKHAVADCLLSSGYIASVSKKMKKNHPVIEIGVLYKNGKSRVSDVKFVSKPSRRIYMGVKDIKKVKNGHGILVLSTPKGIMTGADARKEMVGGEALFMMW